MKECSGSPSISQCDRYKLLGTCERKAVVRKLKLCMNCLGRHFVADCPSKFSCRTCNGRHHTSLHFDRPVEQQSGVTSGATFSGPSVLLKTAMVGIDDAAVETLMFRALLDSGSQTSFMTADAASKLNIARSTVDVKVSGIGERQQAPKGVSQSWDWSSKTASNSTSMLNSIAVNIPSQSINLKQVKSMKNVVLADENFHQPGPVKLLLGADVYEDRFLDERRKAHGLHYRKSIFGWVVTGVCPKCVPTNVNPLKLQWSWILYFWENEEIPRVKPMSKENRQCVLVWLSNLRHVPRTTFKQPSFIDEFVDMGHLEQAPQAHGLCYYLPHHCVFKDSTTTKLRVVFDASSKSPNDNSLNDCLLLGPCLQDDVFDILIRFRLQQYTFSSNSSLFVLSRCQSVSFYGVCVINEVRITREHRALLIQVLLAIVPGMSRYISWWAQFRFSISDAFKFFDSSWRI